MAGRSSVSKIATPVREPVACHRPMIFTPSPASARSCGDIDTHFFIIGRYLSWPIAKVTRNFMIPFPPCNVPVPTLELYQFRGMRAIEEEAHRVARKAAVSGVRHAGKGL